MLKGIIGYFMIATIVGVVVYQYNPKLWTKLDAIILGLFWPLTLIGWIVIGISKELG